VNDCISQRVDIQLNILQTVLSLITNFSTIHGRLLANVVVTYVLSFCAPLLFLTDELTDILYAVK